MSGGNKGTRSGALAVSASVQQGYEQVTPPPGQDNFLIKISENIKFSIKCINPSPQVENKKRVADINKTLRRKFSKVVIRKSDTDLSIAVGSPPDQAVKEFVKELNSAKLASFSFARDHEKDSKSASFEGVIGYRFGNFTPYLLTNFKNQDGRDKDIQIFSPGLLYDRVASDVIGEASVHFKAQAFGVLDLEQNGERVAINVSAEPGFSVTEGFRIGAYDYLLGSAVLFRPTFNLLAEGSVMLDAGRNMEFQNTKDFIGLGSSVGVQFMIPNVPIIESATLSTELWYLHAFGSEDSNYDRFEVSLDWTPKDVPYFGITASYVKGENKKSFQDEEVVKLGLGVRF